MKISIILTLALVCFTSFAEEPPERKIRPLFCIDGDTFITAGNKTEIVRLWGVDAPELDQRFGIVARSAMIELVQRKQCHITTKGESYGRTVGLIRREKSDIGLELIKMGLAWHDPKYAPNRADYAEAQEFARKEKRGLWSDDKPISPWQFRANRKPDSGEQEE